MNRPEIASVPAGAVSSEQYDGPGYAEHLRVHPRYLSACLSRPLEASCGDLPAPGDLSRVEEKLLQHPAVKEAGALEHEDSLPGQAVTAFVSLREGFLWSEQLEQELKDWVRHTLSTRLVPREIKAWDRLPRTRSGKLLRHALRSWDHETSNHHPESLL